MKTLNKIKYLLIVFFIAFSFSALAQGGPGDPNGDPEGGGDPVGGGGAPNTGHSIVLLSLALTYGGKKIYDYSKFKQEDIV
jgi:hypothetical protein